MTIRRRVLATLLALSFPMAALAEPAKSARTADGKDLLQTPAGMTLYVSDADQAHIGKSDCNGACAEKWLPLAAAATDGPTGDWTVIGRDDGTKQWAYKGRPLYTWTRDTKPGDMSGNSFNGNTWHVAVP